MWWLGAASAVVSAGAAVQLLVLTARTADLFAWTIAVPASASFLGMFYLAAAVMGVLGLRQPLWAPARTALLPVVTFVTLVHIGSFHLFQGGILARSAAWVWLAVYVLTPPVYAVAIWHQRRAPGVEPARTAPLPGPVRWLLSLLGVVLAGAGGALLFAPQAAAPSWPWALTVLTARMTGATLFGVALLAGSVVEVNDRPTVRPAGRIAAVGLAVCAVLVVLGYGAGAVRWSGPSAWIYLAVCVLLGGTVAACRPPRAG
jgi:hypothetical protein